MNFFRFNFWEHHLIVRAFYPTLTSLRKQFRRFLRHILREEILLTLSQICVSWYCAFVIRCHSLLQIINLIWTKLMDIFHAFFIETDKSISNSFGLGQSVVHVTLIKSNFSLSLLVIYTLNFFGWWLFLDIIKRFFRSLILQTLELIRCWPPLDSWLSGPNLLSRSNLNLIFHYFFGWVLIERPQSIRWHNSRLDIRSHPTASSCWFESSLITWLISYVYCWEFLALESISLLTDWSLLACFSFNYFLRASF